MKTHVERPGWEGVVSHDRIKPVKQVTLLAPTQRGIGSPPPKLRPVAARKYEHWWLCGLILSFAYERPIFVLSSMDRINPRLFDVMVIIGVLFVLPRLRRKVRPPQEFYIWALIVAIYVVCALVYVVVLLPPEYGEYSLFFAGEYLEGLLAIYMALKIPLSLEQKASVMWAITFGGIYVATYSIYQYFTTSAGGEIEIAPGKFVHYFRPILTGPLSYNYFQIAQFSSLCAIVTLCLMQLVRRPASKWGVLLLSLFVGWPLLFSGSRTGLGLLVISMIIGFLFVRGAKWRTLVVVLALGVVMTVTDTPIDVSGLQESETFSRLSESERTGNSIESRLSLMFRFDVNRYKWGYLMPLIGSGFYVAPAQEGSLYRYRVGYGIHNTFLFPLEQGGLSAAILFIVFLIATMRKLNGVRRHGLESDRALAIAALSYMLASLPAYLGGQIFWVGFGTGHFNALLVIVLLLAVRPVKVTCDQTKIQDRPLG